MPEIKVLLSEAEIQKRVKEIGAAITRDHAGQELLFLGALKGCFIFMADLIRAVDLPLSVEFVELSSYGDAKHSSGSVTVVKDLQEPIEGKHIIVVEDIVDSGITMNFLMEHLSARRPASLKIASLLVKAEKHGSNYPIDYTGFEIKDEFVIGYGLDFAGRFRNLPYVGLMTEE